MTAKTDKLVEEVIRKEIEKERKLGQFAAHEIPVHVFVRSAIKAGRQAIIEEVEKKFFRIEPFPSYWVIDEVDWQAIKKQVKA